MHKKSILMLILMTIPLLIAFPYSLFPSSPLNQKLTTTLPFTYIYAFPLLFGCLYFDINDSSLSVFYITYKMKIL